MNKIHFKRSGRFETIHSACGLWKYTGISWLFRGHDVAMTDKRDRVTCKACQNTQYFRKVRKKK